MNKPQFRALVLQKCASLGLTSEDEIAEFATGILDKLQSGCSIKTAVAASAREVTDADQVLTRVAKLASEAEKLGADPTFLPGAGKALKSLFGAPSAAVGFAKDTVGLGTKLLPWLIGAPLVAGAGTGYLAGKVTGGLSDEDIDEIKKQELIATYNQASRHLADQDELARRVRQHAARRPPQRSLI